MLKHNKSITKAYQIIAKTSQELYVGLHKQYSLLFLLPTV
jgi:hypothetical protein